MDYSRPMILLFRHIRYALPPLSATSKKSFANLAPCKAANRLRTQLQIRHRMISPPLASQRPQISSTSKSLRQYSTSAPEPSTTTSPSAFEQAAIERPSYQMTFTCKPCLQRSSHVISKQGYHYGAVLITCPHCQNRHVISDHLGIFADQKVTIEDLMRQNGERVKRGTLGKDGDIEFWDDEKVQPEKSETESVTSKE